jgi:hypothetical protein
MEPVEEPLLTFVSYFVARSENRLSLVASRTLYSSVSPAGGGSGWRNASMRPASGEKFSPWL